MSARRLVAALLIAGAVLVAFVGGWGGLAVYAFFVLLVAGLAWGVGAGGSWLESASRSRFDRDDR